MPNRKAVVVEELSTSERWPRLFKDVEVAQALLEEQTFQVLLEDLRQKVAYLSRIVVHNIPVTDTAVAEHNFMRGKISAMEDLIGLQDELKQWKEAQR